MRHFTFLTVALASIVLILVGKVVYEDYLPDWTKDFDFENSKYLSFLSNSDNVESSENIIEALGANILKNTLVDEGDENSALDEEILESEDKDLDVLIPVEIEEDSLDEEIQEETPKTLEDEEDLKIKDFEDPDYIPSSLNAYIREEQVKTAGFTKAYIEEEAHNGYFYKTVFIDDLKNIGLRKFVVRDASLLYAKVYVFSPEYNVDINSLYDLLKSRSESGANASTNTTNQFGDASFYMNDDTRSSTAFLTVKFDSLIYGFAYPKDYHKQVVNLIKLIALER